MNTPDPDYDAAAMLTYLADLGLPEPVAHAITAGAEPSHPQIAAQVRRWADRIMPEVDADITRGQLPADVATWAGLERHVDVSGYLSLPGSQVPWGADLPATDTDLNGARLIDAVTHEVERRLGLRAAMAELAASLTASAHEAAERLGFNTEEDETLTAVAEELSRFAGISFSDACDRTDGMWPAVRDADNTRRAEIIAACAHVDARIAAAVVERVWNP